jgi:Trypsin-like peptidase domain
MTRAYETLSERGGPNDPSGELGVTGVYGTGKAVQILWPSRARVVQLESELDVATQRGSGYVLQNSSKRGSWILTARHVVAARRKDRSGRWGFVPAESVDVILPPDPPAPAAPPKKGMVVRVSRTALRYANDEAAPDLALVYVPKRFALTRAPRSILGPDRFAALALDPRTMRGAKVFGRGYASKGGFGNTLRGGWFRVARYSSDLSRLFLETYPTPDGRFAIFGPGDSGGPVTDESGRLVGILSMGVKSQRGPTSGLSAKHAVALDRWATSYFLPRNGVTFSVGRGG